MNCTHLNYSNSDKLINFFNGWGMDENAVSHLDCGDYDVVMLYDYNNLEMNTDFSGYREKHIVAWSMGVMIAGMFDWDDINSASAFCGTPMMIDDEYGIPLKIYNLTVRGFDENSSKKFMERMFLNSDIERSLPHRTFESQKTELAKMLEYKPLNKLKYTRMIAADCDKIVPFKNQLNYWKTPEVIHSGHCPFELYTKWEELL